MSLLNKLRQRDAQFLPKEFKQRGCRVENLLEMRDSRGLAGEILENSRNIVNIAPSPNGTRKWKPHIENYTGRPLLILFDDPQSRDRGVVLGVETILPVLRFMSREVEKPRAIGGYGSDTLIFVPYPRFDSKGEFNPQASALLVMTSEQFKGLQEIFRDDIWSES